MDLSKINVIVSDCDGVLTDGRLNIDHTGEKMFKSFHSKDVRAIRELVAQGFEFYIVTADDWPGGKEFAEKVGAIFVYLRDKSKVREHIGDRPFLAIGDDVWDVPMLKIAEVAFIPSDGHAFSELQVPGHKRLPVAGGRGVIAELLNWIL